MAASSSSFRGASPFGGREGDCFWYNGVAILAHMIAVDGAFLGILDVGGSGGDFFEIGICI